MSNQNLDAIGHVVNGVNQKLGTNYGVEDLTFADVVLDDPSVVGLSTSARNSHIEARYTGGEDRGPFRMRVNYNRLRFDILFGEEPTIDVDGKRTTHDLLSELSDLAMVEILASDVEDTPIDFQDPDRPVFTLTAKPLSRHYFGSVQFIGNAVAPPVITGRRHLIAFHEESFVTTDFETSLEGSNIAMPKPAIDAPWTSGVVGGTGIGGEYAAVSYFEDNSIGRSPLVVRFMNANGTQSRHILLSTLANEYGPSNYSLSDVWPGVLFEAVENRAGSITAIDSADRAVWHKGYLYVVGILDSTRNDDEHAVVVRIRHDESPMVVEPVLAYRGIKSIRSDGNVLVASGSYFDDQTISQVVGLHIATDGSDWVLHEPAFAQEPSFAYGETAMTVLNATVDENNRVDASIAFGQITTAGLESSTVPSFVGPTADVIGYLQAVHNITTTVDDGDLSYSYVRAYLGADNTGLLVLSYYYSKYDEGAQQWIDLPITVFSVLDGGQWSTTHITSDSAPFAGSQMPIYRSGDNYLVAGSDFGNVDGQIDAPMQLAAISTNGGNGWAVWTPPARFMQVMIDQGYDVYSWLPMAITPMLDPPVAKVGPETVLPQVPTIGEPKALRMSSPVVFRAGGNVWIAEAINTGPYVTTNDSADTTLGVGYFNAVQAEEDGYLSTGKGLGEQATATYLYLTEDARFQFNSDLRALQRLTETGRVDTSYVSPIWTGDIWTSPIVHIEKHSNGSLFISCAENNDYNTPLSSGAAKLQLYITDADGGNLRAVDVTGASVPADVDLSGSMAYRFLRTEELANGEVLGWALSDADSEYHTKSYLCRISAAGVLLQMVEIEDHLARYNNDALDFSKSHNAWHVTDTSVYFPVYDQYYDNDGENVLSEVRAFDLATLARVPGVAINLHDYGQENIALRLMPVQTNTNRLYFSEDSNNIVKLYHLDTQGAEPVITRTTEVPPFVSNYGEYGAVLTCLFRDPEDDALWLTGNFKSLVFGSGEDAYPLTPYSNVSIGRVNVAKLGGSDNAVRPAVFEAGVQSPWHNTKEALLHDRHTQVAIGVIHNSGDDAQIDYEWASVYQYSSLDMEADADVTNLAVATTTTDKISALLMRLSAISPTAPLLSFSNDTHSIDDRYPDTVNGSAKLILSYGGDTVELGLGISVEGGTNETYLYRFAEGPVAGRIDPPSYNSDAVKQDRTLVSGAYFLISDRQIGELFGVAPGTAMDGIEGWVEWNGRRVGILFDMSNPAAAEELPFFMGAASTASLTNDFATYRTIASLENAPMSATYSTSAIGAMPDRTIYSTTVTPVTFEVFVHWSKTKGDTWEKQQIEGYRGVSSSGAYFKGAYYTVLTTDNRLTDSGSPISTNELVRISMNEGDTSPTVETVFGTRSVAISHVAADDRYIYLMGEGSSNTLHYSEDGVVWRTMAMTPPAGKSLYVQALTAHNGVIYGVGGGSSSGIVICRKDMSVEGTDWTIQEFAQEQSADVTAVTDAYIVDGAVMMIGGNRNPGLPVYGGIWRYVLATGELSLAFDDSYVRLGKFLDNGHKLVYTGATQEGAVWRRRAAFCDNRDGTDWYRAAANVDLTSATNVIPVQGSVETLPVVPVIGRPEAVGRVSSKFQVMSNASYVGTARGAYTNPTTGRTVVWGEFVLYRLTPESDNVTSRYMLMLNADGTVDTSWTSPYNSLTVLNSQNKIVECYLEDDGSVIVQHGQRYNNGQATSFVHRYGPTGVADTAFSTAMSIVGASGTNAVKGILVSTEHLYLHGTFSPIDGNVAGPIVRFNRSDWSHDANWYVAAGTVSDHLTINSDESLVLAHNTADGAAIYTTERDEDGGHTYAGDAAMQAVNKAGLVRSGKLYANSALGTAQTCALIKHDGKNWIVGRNLLQTANDFSSATAVLELDDAFEIVSSPTQGKVFFSGSLTDGQWPIIGVTETGIWTIISNKLVDENGAKYDAAGARNVSNGVVGDNVMIIDLDGSVRTTFIDYTTQSMSGVPAVGSLVPAGGDTLMAIGTYTGICFNHYPTTFTAKQWYCSLLDVGLGS